MKLKRGRKVGSTVFSNVTIEDLSRILKPHAAIPVSAKFLASLNIAASSSKLTEPEPKELAEAEGCANIQIEEEDWN